MLTQPIFLLPIGETISSAWSRVKGSKSTIIGATFVYALIMLALTLFGVAVKNIHPYADNIVNFFAQIIHFIIELGFIYIGIQRAYDLPITFTQMFRAFNVDIIGRLILMYLIKFVIYLPFIIVAAVSFYLGSFAILIGILACLCLFYVAVRLLFGALFILDKETINPWLAIKLSYAATRGNFWRLVAFFIIQTGFFILGAIPLLVGLIWVIPLNIIMLGMMYKQLLNNIPDKI